MSKTLVPIKNIVPDPDQPRKYFDSAKMGNLKKSIEKYGIINPITVEKQGEKYFIIDGERRFRAATEIGVREIPINIVEAKEPIERMVEQFHLQEMHEGWTPVEKAMAIQEMCLGMKTTFMKVCELLNIPRRTAAGYFSMTKIALKSEFTEKGINIDYATPIVSVVKKVKSIKVNDLDEEFLLSDARKLEGRIIQDVHSGEIGVPNDVKKLLDIFKSSPKSIEKYMEGTGINQLYTKSGAKYAHALRGAINGAGYLNKSIFAFLENPNVKLENNDVSAFKRCRDSISKLLAVAGKD